jgi:hypothetical protein
LPGQPDLSLSALQLTSIGQPSCFVYSGFRKRVWDTPSMNMANLETYYMNLSLTTISRLPLSMKSTAASVSNASRLSWRIIGVARRLWFQWSRRLFSTTRQRANDASRDKPCFDDNLDAITSTQTSKHRNIINICRNTTKCIYAPCHFSILYHSPNLVTWTEHQSASTRKWLPI